MKTTIATLGLAAASATGIGAITLAPAASAGTPQPYVHRSANYTSAAQCNYYRSHNPATLRSKGASYITIDSGCHKSGSTWTYGAIRYASTKGPLMPGDKWDFGY